MKKKNIFFIIFVLYIIPVFSQEYQVKGKVVDFWKNPIAGVLIQIKGEEEKIITDLKGAFKLYLNQKGRRVFFSKKRGV